MTRERLEELRQMAGGVDGQKSQWMDELIDHIDELEAKLPKTIDGVPFVPGDPKLKLYGKVDSDGNCEMYRNLLYYRGKVWRSTMFKQPLGGSEGGIVRSELWCYWNRANAEDPYGLKKLTGKE